MSYYTPQNTGSSTAGELNTLNLLSFLFAISGFGIPAVVCGHVGLVQANRHRETGTGLAFAGLIIGYLEVIIGVLIALLYLGLIITALTTGLHTLNNAPTVAPQPQYTFSQ